MPWGYAGAVKSLLLVALVAGCGSKGSSGAALAPAEVQQIRDLVKTAQAKADGYANARQAGLRAAWSSTEPGTAACPVTMPKLPAYKTFEDQSPQDREALDVAHWQMTVVSTDALFDRPPPADEKMTQRIEREMAVKGPRRDQFERQSSMLLRIADAAKVPGGFKDAAEILALANEIGSDKYWAWELVVVAAEQRQPMFNPDGFVGGEIRGKAFLWTFQDGRVACAANVSAASQTEMKLSIDPKVKDMRQHQVLNDDLKNQAYRAAIEGLRAVP